MTDLAIVGLGSWGLCVLERTVSRARQTNAEIRVHVIEPESVGGGVYSLRQPDYLVLNNACNQLSLYAAPDEDVDRPYAVGLFDWAVQRGYKWVGYECRIGEGGRPIEPTDYLPRRLMGEYLVWFYETLLADAPANLEVVRHYASAVDISSMLGGREAVLLDDGQTLTVDHVILTSGHTWNAEPGESSGPHYLRPYPVDYFDKSIPAGAPVAIAGMGLVAFDVLTALSVGRGGTFDEVGNRLRYRRNGREPIIYLYSRSSAPYCAKSAHGIDPYGEYHPIVCTPEKFHAITHRDGSKIRRQVDLRKELLPLLFDEMQARYHTHSAFLRGGEVESSIARERLRLGALEGHYDAAVIELESRYGHFDPAEHLFAGSGRHYESSQDYLAQVCQMIETDLDAALTEGGSPIKAAQEVLRILRDQLRAVIEFGGLSLESYVDFQSNVRSRINRIEAGPPFFRSQQLLGLIEAGVVRIPFGPNPDISTGIDGRLALRSTQFDRMYTATVNSIVRGHLDLPSLARSASPLLNRLYAKGRLTQLTYGDTTVGSVAINESLHPYDTEGRAQSHLSLLGVLTEGVRYFTHYLPSPRSRLRAVLDAQACVEKAVG